MSTAIPVNVARPGASGDVFDDLVRQIMHIDHRLADAGITELVENVVEQRASRHAHQRLGHAIGQRAHAQAEAGGENHGFLRFDGHLRRLGQ